MGNSNDRNGGTVPNPEQMKPMRLIILLLLPFTSLTAETITIEAESFTKQTLAETRKWEIKSDLPGASGGKYIQALPDTRKNHDDKLIQGENFSEEPGKMAVLEFPFEAKEAGRYFVWARVFSSNSEDNGLHFGLNDTWPESGRRWQTIKTGDWHWDCKQRTPEVHIGVPMQLWLDVKNTGKQTLLLSMREDGTAVDQITLTNDPNWRPPGVSYEAINPSTPPAPVTRQPDGSGTVEVTGELKQWHKVTLTLNGPFAHERDTQPNPFTDCRFDVTFTHESGSPTYLIPGYFATDGNAAESSAESGTKWRAHLSPDKPGKWTWRIHFSRGSNAAVNPPSNNNAQALPAYDGKTGHFTIAPTDKTGRDFRAHGRLRYVGKHYLQFAGSDEYFLKAGADSPETLLAYADFDATEAHKKNVPLKTWQPHLRDWSEGDPQWHSNKGRGLIGALNYLSNKGVNSFSFLTYNTSGDGDNVWPFIERDNKLHYDCSKLDQWGIVFDHATARGLYLHFKLQENEMDDQRAGPERKPRTIPAALDGGALGPERNLYCREMIARFGHALALNWNIGEENTQSTAEVRDMAAHLRATDPYDHLVVLHTFPHEQEKVYSPLLGESQNLTGVSLQNLWNAAHQHTLQWVRSSAEKGHPWVVAQDEQGPAGLGVPPDAGYDGYDGLAIESNKKKENAAVGDVKVPGYTSHDIRKHTLWGTLMAGGAGVEYYFGYSLPQNDLVCQDLRSRDQSWDYCQIALDFFRKEKIPFHEMTNANALIGNIKNDNSRYCFAKSGALYLVYLPDGGACDLDLTKETGEYSLNWFNPRTGGALIPAGKIESGKVTKLVAPDAQDWLAVMAKG
jgi:Domain of unknown function (DUF5060)/Putative collagen-binding domain of a collagenase